MEYDMELVNVQRVRNSNRFIWLTFKKITSGRKLIASQYKRGKYVYLYPIYKSGIFRFTLDLKKKHEFDRYIGWNTEMVFEQIDLDKTLEAWLYGNSELSEIVAREEALYRMENKIPTPMW